MAGIDPKTLWEFAKIVSGGKGVEPTKRVQATFLRTDRDGTGWVRLAGSSEETPVNGSSFASAKAGDTVELTIGDGVLSVSGNSSDPAVGQSKVNEMVRPMVDEMGTRLGESVSVAEAIANAAQKVANAVNQHFFSDSSGIHVTSATQDEWDEQHAGPNVLINSIGQLFRDGLNNLLTLTTENGARALTIWDGLGNAAANVRAIFGETIQLGNASSGFKLTLDPDSLDMVHGIVELFHVGYAEGTGPNGVLEAPFYSFGQRGSGTVGNYSLIEGLLCKASGYCAHAEGLSSTASGKTSHAEGGLTSAGGKSSHAEGEGCRAVGDYSHAEGSYCTANGVASHAGGEGTETNFDNQTAVGKYNYGNSDYAFMVGNGNSSSNRSNAFAVTWDGKAIIGSKTIQPESGYVGQSTPVPAGGYLNVTVSFAHTHASAPAVVVGLLSTSTAGAIGSISVAVASVTTTGFTARLFNSGNTDRSPGFYWLTLG